MEYLVAQRAQSDEVLFTMIIMVVISMMNLLPLFGHPPARLASMLVALNDLIPDTSQLAQSNNLASMMGSHGPRAARRAENEGYFMRRH